MKEESSGLRFINLIKLFIAGLTYENVLDALVNLAGLVVTIIVFIVAFKAMIRMDYASFKREFENSNRLRLKIKHAV